MSLFCSCWKPVEQYIYSGVQVADDQQDALLWHKDLTQYATGDFSIAVVQANPRLEDQSQVKVGPYGTIIGVYDGHGGPEAARFITNHLFQKIEGLARDLGGMSADVLKQAFSATEEEFLRLVDKNWRSKPKIASVGSCCLAGVISGNNLFVANVGDSRVVLGTVRQGMVVAQRMLQEHNANYAEIREELIAQHPDDSEIVLNKHGIWRVKGIIQVSRSIGDAYLKKPELNKDLCSRSGTPVNVKKPVLSAEPALHERTLTFDDRFLIFASDGLWEHLTDQEAVHMVQTGSRNGIARRLVRAALETAAKTNAMSYAELKRLQPGVRRNVHDDISVVVVYLDHSLINVSGAASQQNARNVSVDSVNAPLDIFSSGT